MVALVLAPLSSSAGGAQQPADQQTLTAEQALIERIKQEVMTELLDGEWLR